MRQKTYPNQCQWHRRKVRPPFCLSEKVLRWMKVKEGWRKKEKNEGRRRGVAQVEIRNSSQTLIFVNKFWRDL